MKESIISSGIKVKAYPVFQRALGEGIEIGWNRAHKHTDKPEPSEIKEYIFNEVMNCVHEFFIFDGEDGNE